MSSYRHDTYLNELLSSKDVVDMFTKHGNKHQLEFTYLVDQFAANIRNLKKKIESEDSKMDTATSAVTSEVSHSPVQLSKPAQSGSGPSPAAIVSSDLTTGTGSPTAMSVKAKGPTSVSKRARNIRKAKVTFLPESDQSDSEGFTLPKKAKAKKSSTSQSEQSTVVRNKYAVLNDEPGSSKQSGSSDMETMVQSQQSVDKVVSRRMPEITIHDEGKWPVLAQALKNRNINYDKAVHRFDGIHVKPTDADSHRAIAAFLATENVDHHVYKLTEDKPLRVIIRGLPTDFNIDYVKNELITQGFPILEVTRLKLGQRICPLIYVQLDKTPKGREIYNLSHLCYLSVTVEAKRKPKNTVRQCFTCQHFGHTSSSCRAKPFCAKCGERHSSKECKLSPEDQSTCINCKRAGIQGNHKASSSSCPLNPDKRAKAKQSSVAAKPTSGTSRAGPSTRKPEVSYAKAASGSTQAAVAAKGKSPSKAKSPSATTETVKDDLSGILVLLESWQKKIGKMIKEVTTAQSQLNHNSKHSKPRTQNGSTK